MKKPYSDLVLGKELIVSFVHANYFVRAAGTEQFVRDYSKILQKNGINHLNFFAFFETNTLTGEKIVGVNFNDKFIGIYRYNEISNVISKIIRDYSLVLCGIQIQHLMNHDLEVLSDIILEYKMPVYIFVHDFYLICSQPHMIDSSGKFCGVSQPNHYKCMKCNYKFEAENHFKKIGAFLKRIESYTINFETPSEYVADKLKSVYPIYAPKVIVRPHLNYKGKKKYIAIEKKIKIAFAGRLVDAKGCLEWYRMIKVLYPTYADYYEFYYFGVDETKVEGVKNIRVSVAEQGPDAMKKALKKYDISCALLWPKCAETYSFVYYEMALNGIYILTNQASGNIAYEVLQKKNGKIFDDFEECLHWLMNPQYVLGEINQYREEPFFAPSEIISNNDISEIIKIEDNIFNNRRKPHRLLIETMLYKFKFIVKGIKV